MAAITIRNLPDEVVDALKKRAKRNSRSMEAEVRDALTRVASDEHPPSSLERSAAQRVRAQRFGVPTREINAWLAAHPESSEERRIAKEWAQELHRDRENDPMVDPWERRAAS